MLNHLDTGDWQFNVMPRTYIRTLPCSVRLAEASTAFVALDSPPFYVTFLFAREILHSLDLKDARLIHCLNHLLLLFLKSVPQESIAFCSCPFLLRPTVKCQNQEES